MALLDRDDLAWCEIDGQLIFLDIANDRYFRLPEARNRELLEMLGRSAPDLWRQPASIPRPFGWRAPVRQAGAIGEGRFRLPDIARAMWLQHRVERRLISRSFCAVLLELRSMLTAKSGKSISNSGAAIRSIRAFEQARLLRSAADRCLPRSIALAIGLAADGVRSQVVIGVKLAPFGAHCWSQTGDAVLNDSAEEVLRYQPILVV